MKKLFTLIMAFCLACCALAGAEEAAQPLSWALDGETALSEENLQVFQQAVDGLMGVEYEPVAILAVKESEDGQLFCFLSRMTLVYPDALPEYGLVYVEKNHLGDVKMVEIQSLEIDYTYEDSIEETGVSAPAPEVFADAFIRPVTGLQKDSAGYELRRAQAVESLYSLCALYAFDRMDALDISRNLDLALNALTEEEGMAYDISHSDVVSEALRILDTGEELGSAYEEAGVAESLRTLRNDAAVRESVSVLTSYVETLENFDEESLLP